MITEQEYNKYVIIQSKDNKTINVYDLEEDIRVIISMNDLAYDFFSNHDQYWSDKPYYAHLLEWIVNNQPI